MRVLRVATALAAVSLGLAGVPVQAAGGMSGAEKLRRLDIMLMVTGLRCRGSQDDFLADYGRFTSRQMTSLNDAGRELRNEMAARGAAHSAFDELNTRMANGYGAGHPWLDCGELKQVARNLTQVSGRTTLEEAADQLLPRGSATRLAWAKR